MSNTVIYGFDKTGIAYCQGKIRNSWRGGIAVWGILEEKYLPPYIPEHIKACKWYRPDMSFDEIISYNGYKPTRINSLMYESALREIWALAEAPSISETDRIVLKTTFDGAVVRNADMHKVIEAFDAFDGNTSLKEQAAVLRKMQADDNCIAAGWSQTDMCSELWVTGYDEAAGEPVPYDLNKDKGHWYLFGEEGEIYA